MEEKKVRYFDVMNLRRRKKSKIEFVPDWFMHASICWGPMFFSFLGVFSEIEWLVIWLRVVKHIEATFVIIRFSFRCIIFIYFSQHSGCCPHSTFFSDYGPFIA